MHKTMKFAAICAALAFGPLPAVAQFSPQPTMDGANWDIRYSPMMPLHPTNTPPLLGGGWFFNFPAAPTGACPWSQHTQPPNFDQGPCPHVDYVTTNFVHDITAAISISMTLDISADMGTTFDYHTQVENTCSGAATVRFLLEHTGDSGLSNVNYRYWSNPTSFALADTTNTGPVTISANIDPSLWSNVNGHFGTDNLTAWGALLRNIGKIGMTFGGGCFAGHGDYVNPPNGAATFKLRSFTLQ